MVQTLNFRDTISSLVNRDSHLFNRDIYLLNRDETLFNRDNYLFNRDKTLFMIYWFFFVVVSLKFRVYAIRNPNKQGTTPKYP